MIDTLRFVVLLLLLAAASVWDGRTRRIPNGLTLGGVAAGVVLALLAEQGDRFFLGMLIGGGTLLLLYLGGGVGGGDAKLGFALGVLSGYPAVIHYLFYGGLAALAMMFGRLAWRGELGAGLKGAAGSRREDRVRTLENGTVPSPETGEPVPDASDAREAAPADNADPGEPVSPPSTSVSFALALLGGVLWVEVMRLL